MKLQLNTKLKIILFALTILTSGGLAKSSRAACDSSHKTGCCIGTGCSTGTGTKTAIDCNYNAVQYSIDISSIGETINVPAGTCLWNAPINFSTIKLIGSGPDATIITSTSNNAAIQVSGPTNANPFRISNMTITGTHGVINVGSTSDTTPVYGWRIDHLKIYRPTGGTGDSISLGGLIYGLIDHVDFYADDVTGIIFVGQAYPTEPGPTDNPALVQGMTQNAMPSSFGYYNRATYIEDCTFDSYSGSRAAGAFDWSSGNGRFVFRYNTVIGTVLYGHWTRVFENDGSQFEIYNNKIIGAYGQTNYPMRFEAGTGVIYNNTIQNYYSSNVLVSENRGCERTTVTYGEPLEYCDGSHNWDGNIESTGWPCLGQIGRAPGKTMAQILAGDKQDSMPLLVWNNGPENGCSEGGNCKNSLGVAVTSGDCQRSSDLFIRTLGSPHTNGDVDYCTGSSRPSTCGPNFTNTYVATSYPHPIRTDCVNYPGLCDTSSDSTPPAAPTGLSVN